MEPAWYQRQCSSYTAVLPAAGIHHNSKSSEYKANLQLRTVRAPFCKKNKVEVRGHCGIKGLKNCL